MGLFSSIASIAGSVIGAKSSAKGQRDANRENIEQAETDREFQERMSSTAHQREVADLRAAGLNPILSSKYGGSSTPGGSTARVESTRKDYGKLAQRTINTASSVPVQKGQAALASAHASSARSQALIDAQKAGIVTSKAGKVAMWANILGKPIGNIAKTVIGATGVGVAGKLLKKTLKKSVPPRKNAWNFSTGGKP